MPTCSEKRNVAGCGGIVAEVEIEQREIEQRVKTEALSRVEAAEGIDAA